MNMKDKEKVIVRKSNEITEWIPPFWFKCCFPILTLPARSNDNIVGACFLMMHKKIPYIVTAKHVIDVQNPVIAFTLKGRKNINIQTSYFNSLGLNWISHPNGLDLAAIPFHLPLQFVKRLDKFPITEDKWINSINYKPGDIIRNLGYPEKASSHYLDGTPSNFPQGMHGNIISVSNNAINFRSPAQFGASGGPVFVKSDIGPYLIGVTNTTKILTTPSNPQEGVYLGETSAIPISSLKDIFNSQKMQTQYANRKINEDLF